MNLKGALKKLINDTSSIEGTVVKLYRSQADVRPAHSGTLMRQVWIPEEMRDDVKVNSQVRLSRTARGFIVSDILQDFTRKNLGALAVRQAPAAPADFHAAVRGSTTVFTWRSPGGKIAHYEILQALDSQGTGETIVASPSGLICALQLPGASAKYYAVRAQDIWGQKGRKSPYLQVTVGAVSLNVQAEQRPGAVAFSWSDFSDVGETEVSARYKVDIYREDNAETPVETVTLDATRLVYPTDVAMAFSATVTAMAPNGQQLNGGASAYVEPDLSAMRGSVEITDSEGRTTGALKVLLDASWESGVAYAAQTWHWVQFTFTPARLLDYVAMVASIPRVRAVIALTYDETTWQFYGGDEGHGGTGVTHLGSGALSVVETFKASYLMLQGEEGNRLSCRYPKQLARTVRVYFYPEDGALQLTELIPDTRLIVGFLDALYEIVTGGRMVARGDGGSSIQVGYWSGSESDFGIYATDITGRPFFVLNVPREYLRIGYPHDMAILIHDGNITMDGGMLLAHTVKSEALEATTLSAISANLGQITAGEILMGADVGSGFTGLRLVYPDDEHPGLGVYRDGVIQAILSANGYVQFGEAAMDAGGIRQPLDARQWSAFLENGETAWSAGEASIFDDTERRRVYNTLWYPPDFQGDNFLIEVDEEFQESPSIWVPNPQMYNSFGVKVSPDNVPTEFFVGDSIAGLLLQEGQAGRLVIAEQHEDHPLPAALEFETREGEMVLLRGYGRLLAKVPHTFLFLVPASPGTECEMLYQGITDLYMPTCGWIRRLSIFNPSSSAITYIKGYKNGDLLFTQAVGTMLPTTRYVGYRVNEDEEPILGDIEHYPYTIGDETYIYTVVKPNVDAFDFMPGDVLEVQAECSAGVPTRLQVWIQFLM